MLNNEQVKELGKNIKLSLNDEELDVLSESINGIIAFVNKINDIKEDDTEFDNINDLSNVFREDKVEPSFLNEEILKNANKDEDGFFLIENCK